MHQYIHKLKGIFVKHSNVKLCMSGHTHLLDRVDYNGVTYLCNGSVSGSRWYGSYNQTPQGYRIVSLYKDGSFEYEYVTFLEEEHA